MRDDREGRGQDGALAEAELFEARCVQEHGTRRAHGAMQLCDEAIGKGWCPAGYVEARTASVWVRRQGADGFHVVTCTRGVAGTGAHRGFGWWLTSGVVGRADVEDRHGVLRAPASLTVRALRPTLEVRQVGLTHPAVAYARAVDAAATRVLDVLHTLDVAGPECWAGWVSRRSGDVHAFDFHFMLGQRREELRRTRALAGFAALMRQGGLVTDLRPCPGCQDPSGGELAHAARGSLGLAAPGPLVGNEV